MIRRLLRCSHGGAAVELALFAPLLFMVLGALGLFTVEMDTRNKARDAVNAGSLYVMQGGNGAGAVRDVTLAAWRGPPQALDVTVDQYCLCGGRELACPASCNGDPAPRYTRIRARASVIDRLDGKAKSYDAYDVIRTR